MVTDIFLSRPSWLPPDFARGMAGFERLLASVDLSPRTIGTTDYPTKAPLDHIITVLQECSGAIVVGIPQLRVATGVLKGEPVTNELLLGTEWNHIEAGLAYALGLPLLVIHHRGVSRGIFDRGALNSFLYELDLTVSDWSLDAKFHGALGSWKKECLKGGHSSRVLPALSSSAAPRCPNCGQSLMNPIPVDFRPIEKADWECPRCGFKTAF